jgi:hypothetical protein
LTARHRARTAGPERTATQPTNTTTTHPEEPTDQTGKHQMNNKIQITGLVITHPTITKTKDNGGRPAFAVFGEYLLDNGTRSAARIVSTRKKDMPARIQSEYNAISEGCLALDGPFIVRTFRIGPQLKAA